ncbi:MAG: hypothetical protein ABI683_03670 [Ginsengibacter sp.]
MEFDEMKKIWDAQNNEPLYGINEKALHNRIMSKKKKAYHITNTSELLLIIVNAGAGLFVIGVNLSKQHVNTSMYILSAWMFLSALYMIVSRIRRIKGSHRFDKSMLGDLSHAISVANYQVRLSQVGRWNILPIGVLCLLGLWEGGKPVWSLVAIVILFAFAIYGARWEHNIYKARKRELEILQSKLEGEGLGDLPS